MKKLLLMACFLTTACTSNGQFIIDESKLEYKTLDFIPKIELKLPQQVGIFSIPNGIAIDYNYFSNKKGADSFAFNISHNIGGPEDPPAGEIYSEADGCENTSTFYVDALLLMNENISLKRVYTNCGHLLRYILKLKDHEYHIYPEKPVNENTDKIIEKVLLSARQIK